MMRYFGYNYGYPMMFWGGGWILGILCVVAVVVIIFLVIHYIQRHNRTDSAFRETSNPNRDAAMKILNERYAKGEISDEEYKAKKSNLM